jgi:hypothetical protein
MVRRPYKKDLTPIGKGGITKHDGKGARESDSGSALTNANPFSSAMNNYSKPAPSPAPEPDADDMPRSPGASMPSALMPSDNDRDDF